MIIDMIIISSNLVITSTAQEADQQYSRYGRYVPERAQVVPPGVDSSRFHATSTKKELADVDEFLEKCHQRAKELGISLEYYLEEFV